MHGTNTAKTRNGYLHQLAKQQQEPIVHIEQEPLAAALDLLGATGLSVPDVLRPYQITLPLYIGFTTPRATTEVPHWHPDQAEAYVILDGRAQLQAKYRWEDQGWIVKDGKAGDVLVVRPEVCHWFRWTSENGLALVFKAPQRAGIGQFPAGKVVCKFCPHFENGCMLPGDFITTPRAA